MALVLGFYLPVLALETAQPIIVQAPSPAAPPSAEPSTAEKIQFRKKTIRTMKDELEQTVSAVQARNWNSAIATFGRAYKKWSTFGGTIKRLSPETYTPVHAGFKTANSSLNNPNTPASTVIADLQALIKNVATAVTISDAND